MIGIYSDGVGGGKGLELAPDIDQGTAGIGVCPI